MEYKSVNGPVYCRYAITPPVINSDTAREIGILAPIDAALQAGSNVELREGSNVKLRILLSDRSIRMTCHAVINWLTRNESTGKYTVGFGHLSLSDAEFQVLLKNVADKPDDFVVFGETVRVKGAEAPPVTLTEDRQEITRAKAVTMPVGLIEEIDARRGTVPFSEFVVTAVRTYMKDRSVDE
jgi:hypothetical protein